MYLEAERHELPLGAREPSPSAMEPDIDWRAFGAPKQPHLKSGGSPLRYLIQSNPMAGATRPRTEVVSGLLESR